MQTVAPSGPQSFASPPRPNRAFSEPRESSTKPSDNENGRGGTLEAGEALIGHKLVGVNKAHTLWPCVEGERNQRPRKTGIRGGLSPPRAAQPPGPERRGSTFLLLPAPAIPNNEGREGEGRARR